MIYISIQINLHSNLFNLLWLRQTRKQSQFFRACAETLFSPKDAFGYKWGGEHHGINGNHLLGNRFFANLPGHNVLPSKSVRLLRYTDDHGKTQLADILIVFLFWLFLLFECSLSRRYVSSVLLSTFMRDSVFKVRVQGC